MAGIFIALEGPKGVGKTSLCQLLVETRNVVVTKEPTQNFDLSQEDRLVGSDLASAIAADRRQHVAEVVEPALRSGWAVVCDRYLVSSLVFHTSDGVPESEIWRLNDGVPLPDVNIVLTAPANVLRARRRDRPATRLQRAHDPESEIARYESFASEMERRHGVRYLSVASRVPADRHAIAARLATLISEGIHT